MCVYDISVRFEETKHFHVCAQKSLVHIMILHVYAEISLGLCLIISVVENTPSTTCIPDQQISLTALHTVRRAWIH